MSNNTDPTLYNDDLAPADQSERTWTWRDISALWVAMVVCMPAYMLAGGLIDSGMNWWQAVLTVLLGNMIVLIPMVLVGHAGANYGLPFPVLLRSAFGPVGARIPALARGLVACGWFGINTWVGGSALYVILQVTFGTNVGGDPLPILDINALQALCFMIFWSMHIYFIKNGTESIRWLEVYAAPFLMLMGLALLAWAYNAAGGFGDMLSTPSQFAPGGPKEGEFTTTFIASLTAVVGFWATMALNIPDFTRFAKSQRDQYIGQAIGLPIPMALFAFVAVAVTSSSVVLYGEAIWDPVALASRMDGIGVVVSMIAVAIATLTTNLAANMVAPAYGFSNLFPGKISFKMGGYITAGIGIAIFPWKLLESSGGYIFTWLVGYSALLGPIAGILLADYFLLRRTILKTDDLFRRGGMYEGVNGWNFAGLGALIIGVLPNIPGFLVQIEAISYAPEIFNNLYSFAWFVGFFISGGVYLGLAPRLHPAIQEA